MQMQSRVINSVIKNLKEIKLIVQDSSVTPGGILKNEEDAKKIINYFKSNGIEGLLIGTMIWKKIQ